MATAVRILRLGRVFVANMTGNIAFTGFTITGAPGFSLSASLFALAGFMAGAAIGGSLGQPLLLLSAAAGELILVAAALGVAASAAVLSGVPRDIIAALPGSSFRSAPQRRSAWRPACWPWSPQAPRPPPAIRGPGARAVRARAAAAGVICDTPRSCRAEPECARGPRSSTYIQNDSYSI